MSAEWITTLGTAMGSAWLSGINLYATVVTLGLLERYHLVKLPGDLNMLGEWWMIALAGTFYLIEFIADKIPAVDSAWDAIHTFVRVPAGAILAASAFADFDPPVRVAALLVGGGLALGSHGSKAITRVTVNSVAPGAGAAVSVAEDAIAVGFAALMTFFPLTFLGLLLVALIGTAWLIPRIVRVVRRVPALLAAPRPDAVSGR